MSKKYFCYHKHTEDSLLDSCTTYKEYVDYEVELGHTATAFTEHGKPLCWVKKKMYCDEKGIKYVHGVECYLTAQLEPKVRDNYHTVLLARNYEGVKEINQAIFKSTDEQHMYYNNRLSFDEFLALSDNIIKISACLASPLYKLPMDDPYYEKLVQHYDFLEIQPHNCDEQKEFNKRLYDLSRKYNKPLIAAVDAHSLNKYKAECRNIILKYKGQTYGNEDEYDLTYKTYDELVEAFTAQNALPTDVFIQAIENTLILEDMIEPFELDLAIKYPILYGDAETDKKKFYKLIDDKLLFKSIDGIIEDTPKLREDIEEEKRVFDKLNMNGFMLSMSELISWCKDNNIPVGFGRGSVCGSNVAYITDITDVDPQVWNTVFSRFCNEDREEVGDIDVDVREQDRPKIFEYIISRFGTDKTARVASFGTFADKGTIKCICDGLNKIQAIEGKPEKYDADTIEMIKSEFEKDPDGIKAEYPEIFYYYDGIVGAKFSQSVHPAGMVISPITLKDNYGVFYKDGEQCLMLDMDEVHDCGLVKYDFLILKTVNIVNDVCEMIGKPYPKAHEIDWNDAAVWADMADDSSSIFQMESDYAKTLMRKYKPKNIFEMCHLTACIRPSGASYRDELLARKPHHNPSAIIDELLKDNNGYLIYQCDIIKFLKNICGLSGSEADNVRRAIARKQEDRLQKALPRILEGYCSKSDKPRKQAEEEANEFIQIMIDASSYMFGYNHSVAYCLTGYLEAYLRHYYPAQYIVAYLNNAANEEDILVGTAMAKARKILITPPKFGESSARYIYHEDTNTISKGIGSVRYLNDDISERLYQIGLTKPETFIDVLNIALNEGDIKLKSNQLDILIKIDYFSNYGYIPQLTKIAGMYLDLKRGTASQIPKASEGAWYYDILKSYSSNIGATGKPIKTYKILDIQTAMREAEKYIKQIVPKDISLQVKIDCQLKYLGYMACVTNKPEDRLRLYISKVTPMKARDGSGVWGYTINAVSIGTGKASDLTIYNDVFTKEPVVVSSIVYARKMYKNKRGYWILCEYTVA